MNIVSSISTVFTILLVLASAYFSSDHEQSEISRDKVSDFFFCHGLTFLKFLAIKLRRIVLSFVVGPWQLRK